MKHMVALIDSQHARLFDLAKTGPEQLRLTHPDHHTHRKDQGDAASHPFYEEIASHLLGADEVLVLGHELAKKHFKAFLEAKHPQLAKRVLGYVTVDDPTDAQITRLAVSFLKAAEALQPGR